jgi:hypothetical protein
MTSLRLTEENPGCLRNRGFSLVAPLNGFNQQINLACTNLPPGATCQFSSVGVTPSGSAASVSLTVVTTKQASVLPWRRIMPRGAPPSAVLWMACLGALLSLVHLGRRLRSRPYAMLGTLAAKFAVLTLVLALATLVGSCRPVSTTTGETVTGNYTITITGTLNSNTAVVRSTTINLAVT